jgi:hypothetical protein
MRDNIWVYFTGTQEYGFNSKLGRFYYSFSWGGRYNSVWEYVK